MIAPTHLPKMIAPPTMHTKRERIQIIVAFAALALASWSLLVPWGTYRMTDAEIRGRMTNGIRSEQYMEEMSKEAWKQRKESLMKATVANHDWVRAEQGFHDAFRKMEEMLFATFKTRIVNGVYGRALLGWVEIPYYLAPLLLAYGLGSNVVGILFFRSGRNRMPLMASGAGLLLTVILMIDIVLRGGCNFLGIGGFLCALAGVTAVWIVNSHRSSQTPST